MYCTVLYYTVLYCTILYCTVLYYTVLYCTILYCSVLYCTVLYCTVLCCIVLYLAGSTNFPSAYSVSLMWGTTPKIRKACVNCDDIKYNMFKNKLNFKLNWN